MSAFIDAAPKTRARLAQVEEFRSRFRERDQLSLLFFHSFPVVQDIGLEVAPAVDSARERVSRAAEPRQRVTLDAAGTRSSSERTKSRVCASRRSYADVLRDFYFTRQGEPRRRGDTASTPARDIRHSAPKLLSSQRESCRDFVSCRAWPLVPGTGWLRTKIK